jgi:Fe2+ or Zn2+ uptake regulation protein
MKLHEQILNRLKGDGQRLTPARCALVELFASGVVPLSADEIVARLSTPKSKPDRTTIYRELAFLESHGIIRKIEFGDQLRRYEVEDGSHHHHVVCTSCRRVEDVDADADFDQQERKLANQTGFRITGHSLEFFGLCQACQ